MSERTDWRLILSAFAIGVAGAVQVGRVAPVATSVQNELDVQLATLGWLVSLITLASALTGLLAGYWVVRRGLRRSLLIGAFLMIASTLVAAFSSQISFLLGTRMVEGIGYLLVVVAAPTLIAQNASGKDAPFALAMWGTFFTLGLSIAATLGGAASEMLGWRGWFLLSAGLVAATGILVILFVPRDKALAEAGSSVQSKVFQMTRSAWYLGAAFLGVTLLSLSILSLLPTLLVSKYAMPPGAAGGATGGVAFASILGSLSYGFLASKTSEITISAATGIGLIASGFVAFTLGTAVETVVTCSAVSIFMSGILVAQTFATVPRVAGTPRLIGPTNGLVAQIGSLGALAGPPLVGTLVVSSGWTVVPVLVLGFTASFIVFFAMAMKSTRGHR